MRSGYIFLSEVLTISKHAKGLVSLMRVQPDDFIGIKNAVQKLAP